MSSVITLPSRLYKRLVLKSQQLERTPEEVVTELVRRYLNEPDDRWQAEFRALLARVHARTAAFSSDEIEADTALAAAEAREVRRARRPA
jgi:predicted DNA-binding protein